MRLVTVAQTSVGPLIVNADAIFAILPPPDGTLNQTVIMGAANSLVVPKRIDEVLAALAPKPACAGCVNGKPGLSA